ncbi:complement decay-accelerating factor-like isoform X2 [Passer montanus]|uniref:complement decay-accelerating factor-like isoform X2 n=1 Tax=Passer montanus TaxID=9160 RepID=UPI001960A047|nr:complement decay-accelerating factor-like isoform X2 [Passer montanus]
MGSGRRCSLLLPLPVLLVLMVLPAARGDCGPLPNISHAEPLGDTKHQPSFSVGSTVTFGCIPGYTKLPFFSDTIQCLPNSRWSSLPEFCGRSCPRPRSVSFAAISAEDKMQNFYAVNTTVRYICRQGFENTTAQPPTSTCLDNLTWTEVPQLCQKKSCGIPANPEHGQVILTEHQLGATARVVCDRGYRLKGESPSINCLLQGDKAVWSPLPACQVISCPPPPAIPRGQHSGNSSGEFVLGSVTTYTCEPGLELVGEDTLRCTGDSGDSTGDSGDSGTWSGAPPACRVKITAETNQTKPSEENPYWLASILIPSCIVPPVALGILAGIIMRRKESEKHSYNVNLQKQEMKGRDAAMHPEVTDEKKHPKPWNSYFCSPAKAVDVPRADGTGEAAPWWREAEQPMDHQSDHICPTCESWLRAHAGDSSAGTPGECQDKGPQGPVCPPCTDRQLLSLVHGDTASSPVCPLAGEGTPAHLVPVHSPGCHLCPVCSVPTHAHLCQPQRLAPDG